MSADQEAGVAPEPALSAKQKKRNKKKAARAAKANGIPAADGTATPLVNDSDAEDASGSPGRNDGDQSPAGEEQTTNHPTTRDGINHVTASSEGQALATNAEASNDPAPMTGGAHNPPSITTIPNDITDAAITPVVPTLTTEDAPVFDHPSNATFDALVRERDNLRTEVTELRKSLEEIQARKTDECTQLQQALDVVRGEKETAEHRFRDLLGKVNTIKSQLGERLKADAEEIGQCRQQIEDLEEQNASIARDSDAKSDTIAELTRQNEAREREISELCERAARAQQEWLAEKEELLEQIKYLQNEFEEAKQAMHNWEILATEERTIREGLGEKVLDVDEQLQAVKAEYEKAAAERDAQTVAVERLQKGIDEIQKARKHELRELVESSDTQIEELKKKIRQAEEEAAATNEKLAATESELQRALPFEKEVREKNLLIGKLRHEAVTLNEHLTKALKFLKKGRIEDNVDRHLVTNYLLQFLSLDRSDPKKFQVLQLIGALLGWGDEEKEQAGLARPGRTTHTPAASSLSPFSALRSPTSAMFRNTSTPTLAADYLAASTSSPSSSSAAASASSRKDSLAELWSHFLEQEAHSEKGEGGSESKSHPSGTSPPPRPPSSAGA